MDSDYMWIFIGVCILLILVSIISQLRDDIKRMKLTLDNIGKKIGIPDILTEEIKEELKTLVAEGKNVKAIKKYRIVTGLGLKESKEYVDKLSNHEIE